MRLLPWERKVKMSEKRTNGTKRNNRLQQIYAKQDLLKFGNILMSMTLTRERLRKHKFTDAELGILLEEVTRYEDALFGLQGNCLTAREKYKIWFEITERVCSASGIQRCINDVKRRWQDLKRRTKAKVVDARRHVPRDSSTSSEHQLPDDSFNINTVIKDEEQNSTNSNLPEDLFLDTDSVSPETSLPSVEPEQTPLKDQPFEETPLTSVLTTPHTEISGCSSSPVSVSCPNVSIKAEVNRRCLIGSRSESMHKEDSPTTRVVTSCPGLRVPVRAHTVSCPRRPAVLGSFEQQLLRAHREHTSALREGFRSLTRQNRLLYREMCETNKNVARIASRIAEKNDSVSDVAEELMGIQHKISESIDTTNCLQDRVIDLLASYQERPLIVMPNGRRDARPMEEDNSAYKADH